jgi:hypothetical protein
VDAKIRIDRFAVTPDIVMVQINVSNNMPMSLIGRAGLASDSTSPLSIYDTNGTRYDAVGFIYVDDLYYKVRYTPGQPLPNKDVLPALSVSKPDAKLTLLFRVSRGVSIVNFAIGNKVIGDWTATPVVLDRTQRRTLILSEVRRRCLSPSRAPAAPRRRTSTGS